MSESLTFCGRTFRTGELELMRQTAREFSSLGVTEIARTVCELLEWKRPSGGLKNHECRQLLERLQAEGFLDLPDLRRLGGRGPRRADVSGACCEPATIECTADGHVLTITYEKLLEIYFQNPQFGYYFLVLTSHRLLENIARLETIVAQNKNAQQSSIASDPK